MRKQCDKQRQTDRKSREEKRQSDINMNRVESNELAKGNWKQQQNKPGKSMARLSLSIRRGTDEDSGTVCGKFLLTRRELGNRAY